MFGHRVTVLEGHGRPGGRVYTRRLEVSMPAQERISLCDFAILVPLTIQLWHESVASVALTIAIAGWSSTHLHHLRFRFVFASGKLSSQSVSIVDVVI